MLRKTLGLAQDVAAKKILRDFAHAYHLVYFGSVKQASSDRELVRGITMSAHGTDRHFAVGTFRNHDIAMVDREVELSFPGREPRTNRWIVMQFDLKVENLPQVFIDANHHDELFYTNFFEKLPHFVNAEQLFKDADPLFLQRCKVFTTAQHLEAVHQMLTKECTAMLAHHFTQFDYEINDDQLFIYQLNMSPALHSLREMLRIGDWLATQLDKTVLV